EAGTRLAVAPEDLASGSSHDAPVRLAPGAAAVLEAPRLAVLWDAIVAIEPLGEQPVYDATVPGTHNFVANGILAHNSIEQDSDVVMFVYREEVYKPETAEKGKA